MRALTGKSCPMCGSPMYPEELERSRIYRQGAAQTIRSESDKAVAAERARCVALVKKLWRRLPVVAHDDVNRQIVAAIESGEQPK